jgi:tetratricopeptide (TPR) repeat protein
VTEGEGPQTHDDILAEVSRLSALGDEKGMLSHALRYLEAMAPDASGPVLWVKAEMLSAIGRFRDAAACYEQALADPGFEAPARTLAGYGHVCLRLARYEEGVSYLLKALARPDMEERGRALDALGVGYARQGGGVFRAGLSGPELRCTSHDPGQPGFGLGPTWLSRWCPRVPRCSVVGSWSRCAGGGMRGRCGRALPAGR